MSSDPVQGDFLQSVFGRMSPECCPQKTTHSAASLQDWLERKCPSKLRAESGRTRVWSWGQKDLPPGESSTPSSSAWLNDGEGSSSLVSLSDTLERGPVPQRYFLSSKACSGILRRAGKRGKALPPALEAALMAVASPAQ